MKSFMSVKNKQCAVTTVVSEKEKSLFIAIACELDVPCNVIMRRLIRYFLDKKVSWIDLFRQYNELPLADTPSKTDKKRIRSTLEPEQYVAFAQSVEEWGSTTAVVMRRLMLLYMAGRIERREIW
jgi:hypothetical protein